MTIEEWKAQNPAGAAICDDWCGLATGKEENLLDFAKNEWR